MPAANAMLSSRTRAEPPRRDGGLVHDLRTRGPSRGSPLGPRGAGEEAVTRELTFGNAIEL